MFGHRCYDMISAISIISATGDNETYFKVLIEQVEGRYLSEEEYFPKYVKAHIDRGSELLTSLKSPFCGLHLFVHMVYRLQMGYPVRTIQ